MSEFKVNYHNNAKFGNSYIPSNVVFKGHLPQEQTHDSFMNSEASNKKYSILELLGFLAIPAVILTLILKHDAKSVQTLAKEVTSKAQKSSVNSYSEPFVIREPQISPRNQRKNAEVSSKNKIKELKAQTNSDVKIARQELRTKKWNDKTAERRDIFRGIKNWLDNIMETKKQKQNNNHAQKIQRQTDNHAQKTQREVNRHNGATQRQADKHAQRTQLFDIFKESSERKANTRDNFLAGIKKYFKKRADRLEAKRIDNNALAKEAENTKKELQTKRQEQIHARKNKFWDNWIEQHKNNAEARRIRRAEQITAREARRAEKTTAREARRTAKAQRKNEIALAKTQSRLAIAQANATADVAKKIATVSTKE